MLGLAVVSARFHSISGFGFACCITLLSLKLILSLDCLNVVSYADSEALLDCMVIRLLFLRRFGLIDPFHKTMTTLAHRLYTTL